MENLISRYRNVTILAVILFAQVLGLAVQVKRSGGDESTRLIRLWTVSAVAPLEKVIVWCQNGIGNLWQDYVYLRGVRQENRDLKFEIERLRLEQVRLSDDARQARRLQALLGFKEQYIAKTVAAQVIGSSGSEQSRSVYIDKGTGSGVEKDMAVITADGVVGKVLRAFGSTAQVLLINDYSSGVGAIVDKSRSQGVVRGTPAGEVILANVMTGELVEPGELVVTSGGDQIFPKGLPVGTVMKVSPGADLFLNIRVKPSVNLNQLEEVLVITKKEDRAPSLAESNSVRAVDILTQRLPSVPDKPVADHVIPPGAGTAATATKPRATAAKPAVSQPAASQPAMPQPAVKGGSPAAGAAPPATSPQPDSKPEEGAKTETSAPSQPATQEDKPH